MIKELPLYLQPGGYIDRLKNRANRQQNRIDRLTNRLVTVDVKDEEGNVTGTKVDENNKKNQRLQTKIKDLTTSKNEFNTKIGSEEAELKDAKLKNIKAGIGVTAGAINTATNMLASQMNIAEDSSFHGTQQASQALSAFGPYGQFAGTVLQATQLGAEALGVGTSQINKNQAAAAGLSGGQRVLNNIAGILAPGIGAALGKTMNATQKTAEAQSVSGAYADALNDIDTAGTMGGKRYVVGQGKINGLIDEANRKNAILTEVGRTNTLRKQSDYGMDLAQQNQRIYAGQNYAQSAIGKHGMKIASIDEIKRILELRKQEDDIQAFHNGGVIGIDVNVIPEGKYHAHKNHLGEINEEFEDLTKKGIPVVAHSEGGELEQVAEIEKMELIFRLEVTTQLEELFKDGSEEAMIEAGKLVAFEIMENTQDNSGEVLNEQSTNKNK